MTGGNEMRKARVWLTAATMVALVLAMAAPAVRAEELDEAEIFIEINDTDGDAGIQMFVDGEGWKRLKIFKPNGVKVLDIRGLSSVGKQGITELAFESAEPSFLVQPLAELLALFPEGEYSFWARSTEGEVMTGEAELTHALPDAPVQIYPVEEEVDPDDTVLEWELVADPAGSTIVGYEVVVERDEDEGPTLVFKVDLPNTATSVTVPPEFLEPGTAYKWEVLAVEDSGNQTISEAEFETE
jgi:hypothetical protein